MNKYNSMLSNTPFFRSTELMEARAVLRRPQMAALSLAEKRGRVAALEELTEAVGAVRFLTAEVRETLRDLQTLREALVRDVLRYTALMRETEDLLRDSLPDERHRVVMEAHYLGFAGWEAVADQVGYCPRHVKRLHKEALCRVAERLRNTASSCIAEAL